MTLSHSRKVRRARSHSLTYTLRSSRKSISCCWRPTISSKSNSTQQLLRLKSIRLPPRKSSMAILTSCASLRVAHRVTMTQCVMGQKPTKSAGTRRLWKISVKTTWFSFRTTQSANQMSLYNTHRCLSSCALARSRQRCTRKQAIVSLKQRPVEMRHRHPLSRLVSILND